MLEAGLRRDRAALIGVDGFALGRKFQRHVGVRREHARPAERRRQLVGEILDVLGADAADRGVEAQALGVAEEIAVHPVAFERRAIDRRIGDAAADQMPLSLGEHEGDRKQAVRPDRVALHDRHAGEDAEILHAFSRALDRIRIVRLARLDAGHEARIGGIDALGALHQRLAELRRRPRLDRERDVDGLVAMIGDHVARDDRRLRMAALPPDLDQPAFGREDCAGARHRAFRQFPIVELERVGILVGQRIVGQPEHADLAEMEERAGIDGGVTVTGSGRSMSGRSVSADSPSIEIVIVPP